MNNNQNGYLAGRLLIATPLIVSPAFSHSVILMCEHTSESAMGIIVNHLIDNISYKDLFEQLAIEKDNFTEKMPVHYGGPIDINRGFIIYPSPAEPYPETLMNVGDLSISSSIHTLRDIAVGNGPKERILALGYAGWKAGQIEAEIAANNWISVPANNDIIFATNNSNKWRDAAKSQGIDISKLTSEAGHA